MSEYVIAPGAQVMIVGRGTLTGGMPIPEEWGPETIEVNLKAGGIVEASDDLADETLPLMPTSKSTVSARVTHKGRAE
jgi:hypothetical protein